MCREQTTTDKERKFMLMALFTANGYQTIQIFCRV